MWGGDIVSFFRMAFDRIYTLKCKITMYQMDKPSTKNFYLNHTRQSHKTSRDAMDHKVTAKEKIVNFICGSWSSFWCFESGQEWKFKMNYIWRIIKDREKKKETKKNKIIEKEKTKFLHFDWWFIDDNNLGIFIYGLIYRHGGRIFKFLNISNLIVFGN